VWRYWLAIMYLDVKKDQPCVGGGPVFVVRVARARWG
jgi:hypothetical protein